MFPGNLHSSGVKPIRGPPQGKTPLSFKVGAMCQSLKEFHEKIKIQNKEKQKLEMSHFLL
jgi:hypothetical protein